MIWKVAKCIICLAAFIWLAPRQLISSGTPVGVVRGERNDRNDRNDRLYCVIECVGKLNL